MTSLIITPAQLREILKHYGEAEEIQISGDDGQRGDVYAAPLDPHPGNDPRAREITHNGRVLCTFEEDGS